ncbi:hypothetical protein CPB85DRAFT_1539996 [Mucidula mucida]|nr:hypothetical protein CPB85DRAFT_1539996 [Mucidula mucida]
MSLSSDSPPWRASVDQSTPLSSPTPPTSPNSDIITGSPDTSRLHAVNQSVLECFHLAMEGEEVPAMIAPCHEHPGMNRRTVFGMKLSVGRSQKGNDPFNYEVKYFEDEPYKEMAEDSRFWKTCVDEAAKVDAGKVADWTDALDVLLVFAGLFSGVVSTFVCQTFQNLQVDPTELVYIVVDELLSIQRAIDDTDPAPPNTFLALIPPSTRPEQVFGSTRSGS